MLSASESPALHRIAGPVAHPRRDSRNDGLKHFPPCAVEQPEDPGPRMDLAGDYALCGDKASADRPRPIGYIFGEGQGSERRRATLAGPGQSQGTTAKAFELSQSDDVRIEPVQTAWNVPTWLIVPAWRFPVDEREPIGD